MALLLSESRAIMTDLAVLLHGFMLQIICTMVFAFDCLTAYRDFSIAYNIGEGIYYYKNTHTIENRCTTIPRK